MNAENVGTVPDKRSALSESPPLVVGVDLAGTQIRAAVLCGSTLLSRVGFFNPVSKDRGPQPGFSRGDSPRGK